LRQRGGQKAAAKKKGGSDRSSGRGSEERQSSVPARGTKRGRDNEIEKVCDLLLIQKHTSLVWLDSAYHEVPISTNMMTRLWKLRSTLKVIQCVI
jgi:hypothetical protein